MPDSIPQFKLVDVPGGTPLFGHLGSFKRAPLEAMSACCRRHGDALRFRLDPKTLHLFSHPDLAEEILVQQSDRFVKVTRQEIKRVDFKLFRAGEACMHAPSSADILRHAVRTRAVG